MAIFKCKMCGGTLEINNNETVAVCEYCGTKQTLPKLDDEKRVQLYDRANYFRRENEFDKAMGIYEMILSDDKEDCESYWGIVLCRYGIEYVEDPRNHKRIPTVNRAQFTSIFDDEDYMSAIKYADNYQKDIYEAEARIIDNIQKEILEISNKEEPFDVFICYKETDKLGNRTQDSVYAQDIYTALAKEGYKVFFSRITLEDKLGSAYEPYIFAALNSAKVMLVVGTEKDNFNAVWVKNEWSRYLSLIKAGKNKTLIPCYRDVSPYDLPKELTVLQSQDISKVGWIQDLLRGISKILGTESISKATITNQSNNNASVTIDSLLTRTYMFLEDGDWINAEAYCEKILDIEPENVKAYVAKLLAEQRVSSVKGLANCKTPFNYSSSYKKIIHFGDEKLKQEIAKYNADAIERQRQQNDYQKYSEANTVMQRASTEQEFLSVAKLFDNITYYKDSKEKADICRKNADKARKNAVYQKAVNTLTTAQTENDFYAAKSMFEAISGWRDADDKAEFCQKSIDVLRNKAKAKKIFKILKIFCIIALIVALLLPVLYIMPLQNYNTAIEMIENGQYDEAYDILEDLNNFKNANEIIQESKYTRANTHIEEKDYVSAYKLLRQIKGFRNSDELIAKITSEDSQLIYKGAVEGDVVVFGHYEQDNDSSNGKEEIEWIVLENEDNQLLLVSKYCLDCKPYSQSQKYSSNVWANSSLRIWLNDDFYNTAFSAEEKNKIPTVLLKESPEGATSNWDTNDKVFLLSFDEALYSLSSENKLAQSTVYATANGAWVNNENGNSTWWLRDRNDVGGVYAFNSEGELKFVTPEDTEGAVRPAIYFKYD